MGNEAIVRATLFTPGMRHRWGLPLKLEGEPGTVKSAKVEEIAMANGLHCEVVIASLREPSDFLGLPVPSDDGSVKYAPPAWVKRVIENPHSVVFFDEVNTAPPSVQASLLRVILEGWVGDVKLPDTVRFMMAMNSVEDAAGGHDLAMPMANRTGHLAWDGPSPKEWVDWLLGSSSNGTHEAQASAAEEEKKITKQWPAYFAQATGLVGGYITRNPSALHAKPSAGSPDASGAWASRRTWEMATRALGSAKLHDLSESDTDKFLAAFIGSAQARQLKVFLREMDLPNPADLLDGKAKYEHNPDRLDRTMVVLNACTALVTSPNVEKKSERAAALWKMLASYLETADVILPAARVLCSKKITRYPSANLVLEKILPVLRAAGIVGRAS